MFLCITAQPLEDLCLLCRRHQFLHAGHLEQAAEKRVSDSSGGRLQHVQRGWPGLARCLVLSLDCCIVSTAFVTGRVDVAMLARTRRAQLGRYVCLDNAPLPGVQALPLVIHSDADACVAFGCSSARFCISGSLLLVACHVLASQPQLTIWSAASGTVALLWALAVKRRQSAVSRPAYARHSVNHCQVTATVNGLFILTSIEQLQASLVLLTV